MPDDRYGPGYVYLLRRNDGWYRIGRTAQPYARFRQWRWMARNHHYQLAPLLLVKVENQHSAERIMHRIFTDKRCNWRDTFGPFEEWFKLDTDDLYTFLVWAEIIGVHVYHLNESWRLPDGV